MPDMHKRVRRALVVMAALLVLTSGDRISVFCQQSTTSATLTGRVVDANEGALDGALITAVNQETLYRQTAKTDLSGKFRLPSLGVGHYEITVEANGFTTTSRRINLTIGQVMDLSFRISVAGLDEHVEITADTPLVETARTQVAETIQPREIDNLPLNGRNYLDLALLVPGTSRTNTNSNQRFAETSAVPGQGLSIAGQRNLNNSFVVDGLSANDDAADLTGSYYSQEVIREFQVITSGGIAEFGRASSGVVNILTQSGTNVWHGRTYGFFRNQRFDARNPVAGQKDNLTQGQYGVSIAGPIRRERRFIFTNFEQTRRNDSTVITINPSQLATINSRLDLVNYPGPRIEIGLVPGGYDASTFFFRLDHKISHRNQLSARFNLYKITASNSRNVGGLNAVSRGTALENFDQSTGLNDVISLGTNTLNEARFQFTRSRLDAPVNDSIGPAVNISGIANFGTATVSPLARDIDLYEAVDNISIQHGSHATKGGVDFLYNRVNIVFPGAVQGVYTFSNLYNFLSGNYTTFQQAFGVPNQYQSNPNLGLFIQDEWRPLNNLTLNLGMRYDLQWLPDPVQTDTNNLAPRLGVAFAPGDHKTAIRASFGFFFDRVPLRATSNALQREGSKYLLVQFSPTQPGAPVFPNVLAAQPTTLPVRPNITRIDPQIENSYSEQASVQIERELPKDSSFSIGLIHLRGRHIILSRNVNVPRFPPSAGVPNLGRPDPNWGNISRYEGSGNSSYDGMVLSFNKRAGHWASVRASYTLSKAIDDAGNFFFSSPQNNFDIRDDRGLSDNDQRHRLVISGSFEAPQVSDKRSPNRLLNGFQLHYIFTYASRLPFNILTGNDRNFDTNSNDRPLGVGRNTGRGFDFASLDIRLSRRFRFNERVGLEILAEGFNLLNRANLGIPNNTFGTGTIPLPNYGQPNAAFDSRQFQFGLKVNF
jgi:hypothetical protein